MSGGPKTSDSGVPLCLAPPEAPEIKPPPDQRDWHEPTPGAMVLTERGLWEQRAAAATEAAEALQRCLDTASRIMLANYLGDGCEEGDSLRTHIRAAVASDQGWSGRLVNQIASLKELAAASSAAGVHLQDADQVSASNFPKPRS